MTVRRDLRRAAVALGLPVDATVAQVVAAARAQGELAALVHAKDCERLAVVATEIINHTLKGNS